MLALSSAVLISAAAAVTRADACDDRCSLRWLPRDPLARRPPPRWARAVAAPPPPGMHTSNHLLCRRTVPASQASRSSAPSIHPQSCTDRSSYGRQRTVARSSVWIVRELPYAGLVWSPDGRELAFISTDPVG